MAKWNRLWALILCFTLVTLITGCAAEKELTLSGSVEYTQYDANSQAAGMIMEVVKAEGETVAEGDIIAKIDPSLQETSVAQAEALVRAKETRLNELKAGSREEQIAQAEAAYNAAKAKYNDVRHGATNDQIKQAQASEQAALANEDTARVAYEYAKTKYDEALAAFNAGSLAQDKLEDAKYAMDSALAKYNAAKQQHNLAAAQLSQTKKGATSDTIKGAQAAVDQAQAALDMAKNGSTDFTIQEAQSDLDAANAQLDQAKLVLARYEIKAPAGGILSILNVTKGGMVNTGGYAATIYDPSDLWIHVYIQQTKLKYVSLGQKVKLTTAAWPGETFQGTVAAIADEAQFTPKNIQTDESKENTVFKIKIKIEDPSHHLRAGMTMDAIVPIL